MNFWVGVGCIAGWKPYYYFLSDICSSFSISSIVTNFKMDILEGYHSVSLPILFFSHEIWPKKKFISLEFSSFSSNFFLCVKKLHFFLKDALTSTPGKQDDNIKAEDDLSYRFSKISQVLYFDRVHVSLRVLVCFGSSPPLRCLCL